MRKYLAFWLIIVLPIAFVLTIYLIGWLLGHPPTYPDVPY